MAIETNAYLLVESACISPIDGMVRLWSWEALAHGIEVVSYFR